MLQKRSTKGFISVASSLALLGNNLFSVFSKFFLSIFLGGQEIFVIVISGNTGYM